MANINKRQLEKIADMLKQGSEKAFDELFEMTRDYLFYFIYSKVKNQVTADDLLQETYITVYEKIDQYSNDNFLAWILTIARNKTINYIKKDSRNLYVDQTDSEYMFTEEASEKEALLLKDMGEVLNEEEFEIVMMHVLGNYTHKQIAEGLHKPIGTITWKYSEAMKKLRTKLEV